jgi:hypothetical protein
MNSLASALAGPLPAAVTFAATVATPPRFFIGTHTHARHETFDARTADGVRLTVVDNVAIAPPIAVAPGDAISVRGELVRDRGGAALVHWTHHDPAGRHPDGWIDFAGRRYA